MIQKVATFDLDRTVARRIPDKVSIKVDAFDYGLNRVFRLDGIKYLEYLGSELYGMTDRPLVRSVLRKCGIPEPEIAARIDDVFAEIIRYFEAHRHRSSAESYEPLSGIRELLTQLKEVGVKIGLATGNMARIAWWKIEGIGLRDYFKFGGFGDDAEDRAAIIKIALKRSRAQYGQAENGFRAWHFGDSIADIEAARAANVTSVAISAAGGGTHTKEDLLAAGADLAVDSWSETERIMEFLSD
jgi:phosphoglycolate phosphatase